MILSPLGDTAREWQLARSPSAPGNAAQRLRSFQPPQVPAHRTRITLKGLSSRPATAQIESDQPTLQFVSQDMGEYAHLRNDEEDTDRYEALRAKALKRLRPQQKVEGRS